MSWGWSFAAVLPGLWFVEGWKMQGEVELVLKLITAGRNDDSIFLHISARCRHFAVSRQHGNKTEI